MSQTSHSSKGGWGLTLAALGGVLGDIGTSPLYVLAAILTTGLVVDTSDIVGSVSLVLWTLAFVHVKYIVVALRADNKGAGGIQPLAGLIHPTLKSDEQRAAVRWLAAFATCLLIADGALTPAITLLSAVEGIAQPNAAPSMANWVLPIAIVLAFVVAIAQRWPRLVGAVSGPANLVWFLLLAWMGLRGIEMAPEVLWALSPHSAISYIGTHGVTAMVKAGVFGAVFLAATGGEALYADTEHFGRTAIARAWLLAFPCLVLNYLGQGGLIISSGEGERPENIFYALLPQGQMYWFGFIVAVVAGINASLALFPAVHSNIRQAIFQNLLPRLSMEERNVHHHGQLFSWMVTIPLLGAIIWIMVTFKTASALEHAYGMAIVLAMIITDLFLWLWALRVRGWKKFTAYAMAVGFGVVDLAFFASNAGKLLHGGYLPLTMAGVVLFMMLIWFGYRRAVMAALSRDQMTFAALKTELPSFTGRVTLRPGAAVFLHGMADKVPLVFWHEIKDYQVMKAVTLFLHITYSDADARVSKAHRIKEWEVLFSGEASSVLRVVVEYGFYQRAQSMGDLLKAIGEKTGFVLDISSTLFFTGIEDVVDNRGPLFRFAARIYNLMSGMMATPAAFFSIPPQNWRGRGFLLDLAPGKTRRIQTILDFDVEDEEALAARDEAATLHDAT